jgi:arylsulfatase
VKNRLLKGWQPDGSPTTFRTHLDGFNQLDYLTGKSPRSARTEFAYFNDDGDLVAYRYRNWKAVFEEQKKPGGFAVWYEPFTAYRIPKLFNLRMDPYERADVVSDQYDQWRVENAYLMGEMTFHAGNFLETFKAYPPSQRPASFSIDQIRANVDKVIDESFKKRGIEK